MTVNGTQHTFYVNEVPQQIKHEYGEAIDNKLREWQGVLARRDVTTSPIDMRHSEMLAIAFCVLCRQKHITLDKNLRVCGPCHDVSVVLSQVEGVVITHKDKSRVHVMKHGNCSCRGYY